MLDTQVKSELVSIEASSDVVWQILTDIPRYSEWNPFTAKIDGVEGELKLGDNLGLHVTMPKRGNRVQYEQVKIMQHDPSSSSNLAWGMKALSPLILVALREQIIISTGPNSCQYYSTDSFAGILSPLVYKLFYDDIKQGFDSVAFALKARAESGLK